MITILGFIVLTIVGKTLQVDAAPRYTTPFVESHNYVDNFPPTTVYYELDPRLEENFLLEYLDKLDHKNMAEDDVFVDEKENDDFDDNVYEGEPNGGYNEEDNDEIDDEVNEDEDKDENEDEGISRKKRQAPDFNRKPWKVFIRCYNIVNNVML